MLRLRTLNRSFIAALPFTALLVACGGAAGDPTAAGDPSVTTDEMVTTADPNAPASAEGAEATEPSGSTERGAEENNEPETPLADRPTVLEPGETVTPIVDDNTPDVVADSPEALNPDGSPIAENGKMELEGEEGEDDSGLAEAFGESTEQLQAAEAAAQPENEPEAAPADGVAQTSDALSSTRRNTFLAEARRNYTWLQESTSYYSYTTYMNESTGTRRTDCSGYVGYALRRVLKSAYDKINSVTYGTTPKSEDYFDYFMGRPTSASTNSSTWRFRKVMKIRDLKPGDILVWKNPSWMRNSGHTMVVRDYPRTGRTSKNEILVPIYDSTNKSHSYNVWDSRGTSNTGIGAGTIGIKVDSRGEGVAYYWSGGTSGSVTYRKMVAGRIE